MSHISFPPSPVLDPGDFVKPGCLIKCGNIKNIPEEFVIYILKNGTKSSFLAPEDSRREVWRHSFTWECYSYKDSSYCSLSIRETGEDTYIIQMLFRNPDNNTYKIRDIDFLEVVSEG